MHLYALLDAWPRDVRAVLLGATGSLLAVATLSLPLLRLPPIAGDTAAWLVVLGVAGTWILAYLRVRPQLPRPAPDLASRHRGILAGRWLDRAPTAVRLPEVDASFSLVAETARVRDRLAGAVRGTVGPVALVGMVGDRLMARSLVYDGRPRWIEATFRRVGEELELLGHEYVATPASVVEIDSGWPAARRALLARDEALDVVSFDVLCAQINAEIDALVDADVPTRAASPYLTPDGARSVAFWAEGPGLPPGGHEVVWLSVEEDAWHERVEVQCGLRVLGLCRRAGSADAPWQLWRLRRGA